MSRENPLNSNMQDHIGQIWKLGCNWGKGKPSFYDYIKAQKIVVGVNGKLYNINDLIVVTEGYLVKAVAKVLSNPEPVTNDPLLKEKFNLLEIEYEDWVNFAQVEWYELSVTEQFTYQLQQGICKVKDSAVKQKTIQLWGDRNVNFWIFQG